MTKQHLAVAVGVLSLAMTGSLAWAADSASVKVPFTFFVNNTKLPAGTYDIRVRGEEDNFVSIQNTKGGAPIFALVEERPGDNGAGLSNVVFDKAANGKTYLSEIHIPGEDGFVLRFVKGEETPVIVAHKG